MYTFCRRSIASVPIIAVCIVITLFVKLSYAADGAEVRVLNTTSGNVTAIVKNISDDSPSVDGIIRWRTIDTGTDKWVVAEQYIELTYTDLDPGWGIQIYTHNKGPDATPPYQGSRDPAGLLRVDNPLITLPMGWRITKYRLSGHELDGPIELPSHSEFADGMWHFMKDRDTPDDPSTPSVDESFQDGDDYVVVWNQSGIAWNTGTRAHNPQTAYLYLSGRFTTAAASTEYVTTALTLEAFHDVSPFPLYIYKEGTPPVVAAYDHILVKMNKFFSGDQLRLIESYSPPYPPRAGSPSEDLHDIAFIYDNACAIAALLANPTEVNIAQARLLCKALIWAQQNDAAADGRLRDAYWASVEFAGSNPPLIGNTYDAAKTGNIAWAIIAWMQYYKNSGDTDAPFKSQLVSAAESAGNFIEANFYDSTSPYKGYWLGFDENDNLDQAKSTEANAAVYVAFSHLYHVTGNSIWSARAQQAKNFLEDPAIWLVSQQRFRIGIKADGTPNDNILASDANLLPILALGNLSTYYGAIPYVEAVFLKSYGSFVGIDYGYSNGASGEPDGIWSEGTALLASVHKVAKAYGYGDNSSVYLESLKLIQGQGVNSDYKGIVATPNTILTTGFGSWNYYPSVHLAATSWFIAASRDYNIYWGSSLREIVPAPDDNRSFTEPVMTVPTDYLENHYFSSGWLNVAEGAEPHFAVDNRCSDNPYSGDTCFKLIWDGAPGTRDGWLWGGIVWQEPENEWDGGLRIGYDLRDTSALTFWARTDQATLDRDPTGTNSMYIQTYLGYVDDSCGEIQPIGQFGWIELTTSWQQFSFDLTGVDMSHVANGFTVIFNEVNSPGFFAGDYGCNIYLDDIKYEE